MAKLRLSQGIVNSAACSRSQIKQEITDTLCKGLVLEVRKQGGKTWYWRYTNAMGKQRLHRLGDAQVLTVSMARQLAQKAAAQLAFGNDPCDERTQARLIPTFEQFVAEHYVPYIRSYKRSWSTDVSLLKNHLLPTLGKLRLDAITRLDIQLMHSERRLRGAAPSSANRLLILARYIFNLALRWEILGISVNPCRGIPLLQENNKRERFLSAVEVQRLIHEVRNSPNTMLRFIVSMLILTGARKREVLDARWTDFDLDRRLWRIPISKTGKARHVPLSEAAAELLVQLSLDTAAEWVFANPDTGRPFVSVYYSWNTCREHAGLPEIRMHDLRHSFASMLVNAGRTLYEVQQILGHRNVRTTERYAHLSPSTLRDAANAAAESLNPR